MINEIELKALCNKYKIKYKLFQLTNTIILDTGIAEWLIKHLGNNRDRPYCLMHKNKLGQTSKYHIQGYKKTLFQAIDSALTYKNIIVNHNYVNQKSSHNTYIKHKYKNIKKKVRQKT